MIARLNLPYIRKQKPQSCLLRRTGFFAPAPRDCMPRPYSFFLADSLPRMVRMAYMQWGTYLPRMPRVDAVSSTKVKMNHALRTRFPPFSSESELRASVEMVCADFGKVTSLTILPAAKAVGLQCMCLLRLAPPEAAAKLKSKLDVTDFGGQILFFVEVDNNWSGPRGDVVTPQSRTNRGGMSGT